MFFLEGNPNLEVMIAFIILGTIITAILIVALIYFVKLLVKHFKKVNKKNKKVNSNYLNYFGPEDNIISVSKNLTRVSVEVKDLSLVNLEGLKAEGMGIMITGNIVKCSSQAFADQIEG